MFKISRAAGWPWDRNKYPKTGKADIINALGHINAYTSYLEVATLTTGGKFADVSGKIFTTCQRVVYNVPANYSDGLPVHYTSAELDAETCLRQLVDSQQTFDVVFVDPYHSFEASKIDLEYGIKLLNPGGVLVVHDCNPPRKHMTSSDFAKGYWLGKTYLAFLDFVTQHPELEYCVVDTDWGVGLIFRAGADKPAQRERLPERPDLGNMEVREWKIFSRHRRQILRLISVRQFYTCFAAATSRSCSERD
jgi:hypothetical protein